ncbi:MAG: hypothetical protein ACYDGR_08720 [Candidatus Dormibacteria bacterium]
MGALVLAACGALPNTSAASIVPPGLLAAFAAALLVGSVLLRRRRLANLLAALLVVSVLAVPGVGALADCPAAAPSPTASPVAASQGTAPAFASTSFKAGGAEPNISISPSGRTVIADGLGGTVPATLYRSTDSGLHFNQINPTFPNAGGGDWDMRFLTENTIVATDLSLSNGIYVHRSIDNGDHWTDAVIHLDVYDRPWLDHYGEQDVYVVARGFDAVPYLYTSTDGGNTFPTSLPVVVYGTNPLTGPDPVAAFVTNQNAYLDHLVVDQHSGDVYVLYGISGATTVTASPPLGASNTLYVAHLENGAFVSHLVYAGASDVSCLGGFNWIAVDQVGTVYVAANCRIGGRWSPRLSYSKDHGATWSPLVDIGPSGGSNVYASIAGGSRGNLSLIYLRGTDTDPSRPMNWYGEMASLTAADTAAPIIRRNRPQAAAMHTQDICFDGILCGLPGFGNNRNLLDYIWNAVAPDGTAFGVLCSDGPATGNSGGAPDVVIFRQTAGDRLGRGVQS